MKQRVLAFAPVVVALAAAVSLLAQTPASPPASTTEKLYISLETTDNLAVVDLKTFKQSRRSRSACIRTGRRRRPPRTSCTSPPKSAAPSRLSTRFATKSIKTFDVGFGVEPQNGAITPDGRFLYQPSYAGLLAGVRYAEGTNHRIHPYARHRAQHGDGAGWAVRVSAADCRRTRALCPAVARAAAGRSPKR